MRGGPLAEKRIIQLINRRFVPFFFNVGRNAPGYDAEAHRLIQSVDRRFGGRSVPTPPVWIFTPDLKHVGTISNYAPKKEYFDKLVKILAKHPQYNKMTKKEKKARGIEAAQIHEQIGDYTKARSLYKKARGDEATLGLCRIARHQEKWSEVGTLVRKLQDDNAAMESAYKLLSEKDYAGARKVLGKAVKKFKRSVRLGEMHYWAGVAAFFQGQKDWANFHWCWVMKNLPDDYNYMACYLACTVDAMPWGNPDLGGAKGRGMITHSKADGCRRKAMDDYNRLKGQFTSEY